MKRPGPKQRRKKLGYVLPILFLFFGGMLFSLPTVLVWKIHYDQRQFSSWAQTEFPVTVDPERKIITEDIMVDNFLADNHSLFGASTIDSKRSFWDIFTGLAMNIADTSVYQNLASASGQFVTIVPGMRKEQVATLFANTLKWNSTQKRIFSTPKNGSLLPLPEGSFSPGIYVVSPGTTPEEAQTMVNERFTREVLSRYSTSTQEKVPLKDALTIASLIQRETISTDGMRLISGIMWNRLFIDMKLQIDATLQYTKANHPDSSEWWPDVAPQDKYLASPYNTYENKGLPPTPISNPSVAAILAALNPIKTPCLFYFNDPKGEFHCSVNYEDHVKSIKEYYEN